MSSPLAHAAVAGALGRLAAPARRADARFWAAAIFCVLVPDVDHSFYRSGPDFKAWAMFGTMPQPLLFHRGLMHSFFFAALLGLACAALLRPDWKREGWKLALLLAAITASHGLLDALTNGDLGIAFLAPFSRKRFLAPWRPLPLVEPWDCLSRRGLRGLLAELVLVCLPCWAAIRVFGRTAPLK